MGTINALVYHFGNGDEDDQTLVSQYTGQFGKLARITIFPGLSYGHLEFESSDALNNLMSDMTAPNVKSITHAGKERHLVFFPTPLGFKDLKNKVDFPCSNYAKEGIIPGL